MEYSALEGQPRALNKKLVGLFAAFLIVGAIAIAVTTNGSSESSPSVDSADTKLWSWTPSQDTLLHSYRMAHEYPVVDAFYKALNAMKATTAADLFAEDAVWVHTDTKTVTGKDAIKGLLTNLLANSEYGGAPNGLGKVTYTIHTAANSKVATTGETMAQVVFATRTGHVNMRDAIVVGPAGKIVNMLTTRAHWNDPTAAFPPMNIESDNIHSPLDKKGVQAAVDRYFQGFSKLNNAKIMESAYVDNTESIVFAEDFSPHRKAPFSCTKSYPVCGTAPFFNKFNQLLPAFGYFVSGNTNLNASTTDITVYGDLAYMTTVSYGCEGNYVTPPGQPPMPNRELYSMMRQDGEWKIWLYTFTYNPDIQIEPPAKICVACNPGPNC